LPANQSSLSAISFKAFRFLRSFVLQQVLGAPSSVYLCLLRASGNYRSFLMGVPSRHYAAVLAGSLGLP
jgi:hypothetical protein